MNRAVAIRATLLAGAAIALAPAGAWAQEAPAPVTAEAPPSDEEIVDDGEIVVTARRRDEALQDVPIAVTAFSGAELERQGALDITDVGDVTPNVTLETSRGTNSTLTAFIRGVGQQDPVAGFEQGVGLYIDDVYLNRPQGALLDIYDVERIEILRGPQGTLYGRNTIGGAIKYVTRRLPDEQSFSLRANVGTYGQFDVIGKVSVPIGDRFKIGAGVAKLTRGGFGRNLTLNEDNYNKSVHAVRGTAEFEPNADIFVRLSGDYTWDDSNARGGHRLVNGLLSGAQVLDDEYDSRGALEDPGQKVKGGGWTLLGEADLADGFKVRSITAWRKDDSKTPIDFDALPSIDVDVPAIYRNKQFSQELQLLVDTGRLSGLVGAYYLDADAQTVFDVRLYTTGAALSLPGLTALTQGDVGTKTWAIFGDFTFDITDQFAVSVGLRYTDDRRHSKVLRQTLINGGSPTFGGAGPFIGRTGTVIATTSNFDGKRKDTAFTPRASLSWKPNDDHNIYLSYSRGFKGGGFDPRGQSGSAPDLNGNGIREADEIYDYMAFDPETVDSYELGWKGSAMDKRLRWALALFQADYKDVQVPGSAGGVINGVPTFIGVTTNAGKARFRGLELESAFRIGEDLAAAGDRFIVSGSLGYLDAEYREFLTVVAYDRVTGAPLPLPLEVDVADYRKVQNTPKWTASGTVDYDVPVGSGRLNINSTLSYRSKSQQFELAVPGLDQKGFALLDASIVWRSDRWTVGLHGKNLTDTRYKTAGYNFFRQNPYTGDFILANGTPGLNSTLGLEGILTAYYGNPRQIFASFGVNF
jgi:iron complex outermembrane recepter protein